MHSAPSLAPAWQQLSWQFTTTELFQLIEQQPWAILLDSANSQHQDARFDIVSFAPCMTLTHQAGVNTITDLSTGQQQQNHDDPFHCLAALLAQLFPQQASFSQQEQASKPSHELPFVGGAMGAWNYDLGRSLERLPNIAADDISLPMMNIGFYQWAVIFDYQQQSWFMVHAQGKQALTMQLASLEKRFTAQLTEQPAQQVANEPFQLTSAWHNQISKQEYQQKFAQVQRYLASGDCYQINLTQRFSAEYQGNEWQAYLKLRASNQAPFSAFMRLPEHCLLSISPERFIQLKAGKIQTKPIKGTLPRARDPQKDQQAKIMLANSEKDRAENLMIVDLLRNDIGKVAAAGSVRVPKLFDVESFPAVHHLVSTITATLDQQYQACDLLRAAFPGGSITGAPKIRAMEIIEELEPSRRSLYCGSMGYLSADGQMDTSITIRTLVTDQQRIYCWAGGGIVADSKVEAEYQETFDKISKILPILE